MKKDKYIGIIALIFFILIEITTCFSTLLSYVVPVIIITISTILICKVLKNKGVTLEISKVDITIIVIIIITKIILMSFIVTPLNKMNEFEEKIELTANVTSLEEYRNILGLEKDKYKSEMEDGIKSIGKYNIDYCYKFVYNTIDSASISSQNNNKQKVNVNKIREHIANLNKVAEDGIDSGKRLVKVYMGLDIGLFIYSSILIFIIYRKNRF